MHHRDLLLPRRPDPRPLVPVIIHYSPFTAPAHTRIAATSNPNTAEKYTRLLCEAFLLFTLNGFTFKAPERATANKKAYAVDPGLAACLGTPPGHALGRLAENVVVIASIPNSIRPRRAPTGP